MEEVALRTSDKEYSTIKLDLVKKDKFANIIAVPSRLFGQCFSFYLNNETTFKEISAIQFTTKMNTLMFLHHPQQFMSRDQKSKLITTINKKLFIDIHYELTDNTLGDQVETPCKYAMDFQLDKCIFNVIGKDLMKDFGCVVPFIPKNKTNRVNHKFRNA